MITDHKELCALAARWLKRPNCKGGPGCSVALSEVKPISGESPDAIGFRGWSRVSHLVEVKTSRADFLADSKKPFRLAPAEGMGNFRYFLCPEGLIEKGDLPADWGLLWVNRRGAVKRKAHPVKQLANRSAETWLLSAALVRIGDPMALIERQRFLERTIRRMEQERHEDSGRKNDLQLRVWELERQIREAGHA